MKLKKKNYYDADGNVFITEEGWVELRSFCEAILYKRIGAKYPIDDILSASLIACVEKLPKYNALKNNELGGFLFWTVLGEISKAACRLKKEIPMSNLPVEDLYNGSN